jgi:hypothetical protein
MTETPTVGAPARPANTAQTDIAAQGVDLQTLANKVYDLLLADARLGRARSDSPLISRRQSEG